MNRLQNLNRPQRLVIYFMGIVGGLLLLIGVFAVLALGALNSGERAQANTLVDNVTVREFVALPGEDAYPSTVAVSSDGTLYTGSYATGAIWSITSDGTITELAGTRDALGSVTGLTVAPDGTLYVVDQLNPDPRAGGGIIRRITGVTTSPVVTDFALIPDQRGFIEPEDIVLDPTGSVYVSDRGRGEIWRFDADGTNGILWWTPPVLTAELAPAPTGLAYDPVNIALIVTDGDSNTIYRVSLSDSAVYNVIYEYGTGSQPPGFDGVTVLPDGTIYAALLGQRAVALVTENTPESGDLVWIAAPFRGASDVVYSAVPTPRLYVSNFDQISLALPAVRPQLPFALDVIEFVAPAP